MQQRWRASGRPDVPVAAGGQAGGQAAGQAAAMPISTTMYQRTRPSRRMGQAAPGTVPLFLAEREAELRGGHQWPEAFCLMEYVSSDGNEVEHVWNSRDGIAPYTIRSRLGTDLFHVRRANDMYLPNYRPQPGQRVVIDYSRARAERDAWQMAQQQWAVIRASQQRHPQFRSIVDLVAANMQEWTPGSPLLITISIHAGEGHRDEEEDEDEDGPTVPVSPVSPVSPARQMVPRRTPHALDQ